VHGDGGFLPVVFKHKMKSDLAKEMDSQRSLCSPCPERFRKAKDKVVQSFSAEDRLKFEKQAEHDFKRRQKRPALRAALKPPTRLGCFHPMCSRKEHCLNSVPGPEGQGIYVEHCCWKCRMHFETEWQPRTVNGVNDDDIPDIEHGAMCENGISKGRKKTLRGMGIDVDVLLATLNLEQ